jgi:hypothetical protein
VTPKDEPTAEATAAEIPEASPGMGARSVPDDAGRAPGRGVEFPSAVAAIAALPGLLVGASETDAKLEAYYRAAVESIAKVYDELARDVLAAARADERLRIAALASGSAVPVDIARARKAHQRLVDVAFRNLDRETGEPIRPHFEIPANQNDDDIIVTRALDELQRWRTSMAPRCRRGAWGGEGCVAHEGHDIGEDGLCVEGRV